MLFNCIRGMPLIMKYNQYSFEDILQKIHFDYSARSLFVILQIHDIEDMNLNNQMWQFPYIAKWKWRLKLLSLKFQGTL